MPTRRLILAATAAAFLAAPAAAQEVRTLSPAEARERALILVDVREPVEWAETGVPQGAERINMRNPRLGALLEAATGGDRDAPVALICRTGARSAAVAQAMARAGYTNVYSVEGGLLGSATGPGWLRSGLPVER